MSPQVREATLHDAAAVQAFQLALHEEHLDTLVGRLRPASVEQVQRYLEGLQASGSVVLLAEVDAHIVGSIDVNRLDRPEVAHRAVLGLSVGRPWRRQGVGRLLLRHAQNWARAQGVKRLELDVLANNRPALHLYQAEGFVLEGRKRQAVLKSSGPVDLLGMAWTAWPSTS